MNKLELIELRTYGETIHVLAESMPYLIEKMRTQKGGIWAGSKELNLGELQKIEFICAINDESPGCTDSRLLICVDPRAKYFAPISDAKLMLEDMIHEHNAKTIKVTMIKAFVIL